MKLPPKLKARLQSFNFVVGTLASITITSAGIGYYFGQYYDHIAREELRTELSACKAARVALENHVASAQRTVATKYPDVSKVDSKCAAVLTTMQLRTDSLQRLVSAGLLVRDSLRKAAAAVPVRVDNTQQAQIIADQLEGLEADKDRLLNEENQLRRERAHWAGESAVKGQNCKLLKEQRARLEYIQEACVLYASDSAKFSDIDDQLSTLRERIQAVDKEIAKLHTLLGERK
jgi:hypothetical protein